MKSDKADKGEIASMLQKNNSTFEQLLTLMYLEPFWEPRKGGPNFQQRHEAHKCLNLFLSCKEDLCFGVEIDICSCKHVADVEKLETLQKKGFVFNEQ